MKPSILLSVLITLSVLGGQALVRPAHAQDTPPESPPEAVPAPATTPEAPPATSAPSAASVWSVFSSPAGGFRILMPGTPQAQKQTQNTQIGPIDTNLFMVERPQESVAYMVAYSDLPDTLAQQAKLSSENTTKLLSGVRNGFIESIQGKLVSERSIQLEGNPGTEIILDLSKGRTARNRIYLVNQRLYQVVVITTKDMERNLPRSIDGYYESFRLLPQ